MAIHDVGTGHNKEHWAYITGYMEASSGAAKQSSQLSLISSLLLLAPATEGH